MGLATQLTVLNITAKVSNVSILTPLMKLLESVSADAIFIVQWQTVFLLIEPV